MGRRRSKSTDGAFLQLVAVILVGCAFLPPFRAILLWAAIVGFAVLLMAAVYRLCFRPKYLDSVQSRQPLPTSSAPVPIVPERDQKLSLNALDWYQFEKLVEVVYRQQGYSVQREGGANPDGGIDLIITKDGVDVGVQCKHWKNWKVGVQQAREFLGALVDRRISSGIFITLQEYTSEAREFASKHNMQLLGRGEFIQMLDTIDWKFNPAVQSVLKDKRKLCPKCESEMVLKTATKGRKIGQQFWGCSTYPRCKGIIAA